MYFPKLKAETQQRLAVAEFGGLERRPGGGAGYPAEMENLWSGGYPALETRPQRSVAALLTAPHGIVGKDGLFWVDGTGLYANGIKTGLVLTEGDKQLVGMGAYLLVFPDKKYINTQKLTEYGSMENVRTGTGTATFTLCDETGRALGSYSVGTEAPAEAAAGELWLDTGRAVSVMRQYDGSAWEEMAGVCTKIAAAGIGMGFAAGDGVTVSCTGVRRGAGRTVAVADGVVYYLGNDGVYAFDGSMPVCVSRALGENRYVGGSGGGESGRYWLSALDAAGNAELLVYDTRRKMWHRQDGTEAVGFARKNGSMMVLCRDGRLLDTGGDVGQKEGAFAWSAESGELGLYTPEHKYLARLELRLRPETGAEVKAYIQYDGSGVWEQAGSVTGVAGQIRGAVLHLRPRRCGQLRLKLAGTGGCRVYSAAAVYEKGSDGP